MANSKKILLDIDTGIDDALAILLAVNSPELELIGCSIVAGNTTVDQGTTNTLAVLEVAGRSDVPVSKGAAHPLVRRLTTATHFHGPRGLGLVELPEPPVGRVAQVEKLPFGPQFLIEMSQRYAGELTVIATGPLTNLALALILDPHWMRNLERLVIMGGAVRCSGNISPVAEANFYNDPEAAQAVMQGAGSTLQTPLTLVGLDVTRKTALGWSLLESKYQEQNETKKETHITSSQLALELLDFYTRSYGIKREALLHDPLAVGIVAQPDLVKTERMQVEVETQGQLTRGQSVGYSQTALDTLENKGEYDDVVGVRFEHPTNADVCIEVKAAEFVDTFRQRLGIA